MFTGIITEVGQVRAMRRATASSDTRLEIVSPAHAPTLPLGGSIACSGICLTVVAQGQDWFAIDASAETLARTTLGAWVVGTAINLERPLRLGDELGGHIVSGHVDGMATIVAWQEEGGSIRAGFAIERGLGRYLASKGSVALDGVSLTINEVADAGGETCFGVNLIPHTLAHTAFGRSAVGQRVNVEVDMLARYVDRLKGS